MSVTPCTRSAGEHTACALDDYGLVSLLPVVSMQSKDAELYGSCRRTSACNLTFGET